MLLCDLDELEVGMVVAAAVRHPRRLSVELLAPGVPLDETLIARLRWLGVEQAWVNFDALSDLDHRLDPGLSPARLQALDRLRHDFQNLAQRTLCAADVVTYRQLAMDLVCELTSNKFGVFTDQLFAAQDNLFTHSGNVAYLAVLTALAMETYVVKQRQKLPLEHARDLTALGVGAMLHDIGKATPPPPSPPPEVHPPPPREAHAALGEEDQDEDTPPPPRAGAFHAAHLASQEEPPPGYLDHCSRGYALLRGTRVPAPATQCVLNHHQRYDGKGFPDMTAFTGGRRTGPQRGRDIHIFSRIVAAADVLDHLLREADGSRRPPVAALHDLQGQRFAGWFDPVVIEVMLRSLPPFPIGSRVTLSDGRGAAVVGPGRDQPCRPLVRVLDDQARDDEGRLPTLDLQELPDLSITHHGRHDVTAWRYHLEEPSAALLAMRYA
jgi:HD-GYP domain-containing protein (c-di-GMP phosphodiesterase class II)